jgi:hypothetical protein
MHAYAQTTMIGAGEKVAAPPKPETKSVDKWDKSLAEGDYKVEYATTQRATCRQLVHNLTYDDHTQTQTQTQTNLLRQNQPPGRSHPHPHVYSYIINM